MGLVREDSLFEIDDPSLPLSAFRYLIHPISVVAEQHLFDVLQIMDQQRVTIVPVTNQQGLYLGAITQNELIHGLNTQAIYQSGAILILEINPKDYALSHITQIIESENIQISYLHINTDKNSDNLLLTIQLNTNRVASIAASLVRHGYHIRHIYRQIDEQDDLQNRYMHLMNYLDI